MVVAVWLHKIKYRTLQTGSKFNQVSYKAIIGPADKTKTNADSVGSNHVQNHQEGEKLKFNEAINVSAKVQESELRNENYDLTHLRNEKASKLTDNDETQQDITQNEVNQGQLKKDSNIAQYEVNQGQTKKDSNITQYEVNQGQTKKDSNITQYEVNQ